MYLHPKERSLTIASGKIDYITFGSGPRTLVLIQGLNTRSIHGSALPLAWMYRIFSRDFTVYLFDRRSPLPDSVSVRELAADTAAAMDALHLSSACILGVSQGGMIAQYLAIDRPDLVDRLVLAVTLSRNNDTVTAVIGRWTALAAEGRWKSLAADMTEKMYSASYQKRYRLLLPLLAVLQRPKEPQRFLTLAKSCLTCRAYDELEQITCPVLVIGGRLDQIVSSEASIEIAEKLGCSLYLYDNLGHAAYEEAPDFNQRVFDFFIA